MTLIIVVAVTLAVAVVACIALYGAVARRILRGLGYETKEDLSETPVAPMPAPIPIPEDADVAALSRYYTNGENTVNTGQQVTVMYRRAGFPPEKSDDYTGTLAYGEEDPRIIVLKPDGNWRLNIRRADGTVNESIRRIRYEGGEYPASKFCIMFDAEWRGESVR